MSPGVRLAAWALCLQLLGVPIALSSAQAVNTGDESGVHSVSHPPPEVCFVVRTFQGHDKKFTTNTLDKMLTSLVAQTDPRWEAQIVVMDSRPFTSLLGIMRRVNDSRIQLFAEWVGSAFKAKEVDGQWSPTYHVALYNLTDTAIRVACHRNVTWVVVSNGDNTFDRGMVSAITSAPPGTDAVAVDYYSRYQRPTLEPCTRFAVGPNAPPCKANEMRVCHMDLSAVAWRRQRLIEEERLFGTVDPGSGVAADGLMAQYTVADEWQVHHLAGRCLVHHSPDPQLCAVQGLIWDDSAMDQPSSHGGTCRTPQEVTQLMNEAPDKYEALNISITFDPESFEFQGLTELQLTCIRRADHAWRNLQVYGRVCAAREDFASLPADLEPHSWDAFLPHDLQLISKMRAEEHAQKQEL